MNKFEFFSSIREELVNSPESVKRSFNDLVNYFSKGELKSYKDFEYETLSDLSHELDKYKDAKDCSKYLKDMSKYKDLILLNSDLTPRKSFNKLIEKIDSLDKVASEKSGKITKCEIYEKDNRYIFITSDDYTSVLMSESTLKSLF